MKILLLCWRDTHHPQGGGSERYLERVGDFLVSQGHEVLFHTAMYPGAPRRSVQRGVAYTRAGGKMTVYPLAWLRLVGARLGFGRFRDVDVVVDTQNGIPFFAGPLSGKPTVLLTHHCHREQWPVAGKLLASLGWFLESRISPRVHRNTQVVTVSAPSKQDLISLGFPPDNITIIHNGVDPIPATLPQLEDDGRIHIVTLSRLVPHKQIEHAIDAVRSLPDNVVLDIIGSGWWEDKLRDYIGADPRITLHGQVTEDYKHALLARAAVHLMPSRKEGWGLAVVEAAQHRVPTVGYASAGGLRDSIDDGVTGLLVSDPIELQAALQRLLIDDAFRETLGSAAPLKAQDYSWEETGRRFADTLEAMGEVPSLGNQMV